jgi:putative ABC transport system permease protein
MAKRFWPGEDPIGKRVKRGWSNAADLPWITVVGVVADVHDAGLDKDPEPAWYLPDTQHDTEYMSLVVHTAGDPAGLIPSIRQAIQAVDREQPIFRISTLGELVSGSLSKQRFGAVLLALFAGLGIFLAAVGVYGLMSYTVSQLFHEIGLRMALGADRGDVLRLLLRQGMSLAGLGVALGLAGAVLLTRSLSSLLFGVSPTDPVTLVGAALFLGLVALLAVWVPARRVSRIDPLIALRQQ